jgi:hypothetical protein
VSLFSDKVSVASLSVPSVADLREQVVAALAPQELACVNQPSGNPRFYRWDPESVLPDDGSVVIAPTLLTLFGAPGRWIFLPTGGGAVPPGDPNAVVFYDPFGLTITDNPSFVAAPLSPGGNPQLWDFRLAGGKGALWRQGAWTVAGDPSSVKGAGFVTYGSNATNAGPSAVDGGQFLATPHSFGQYQIRAGVNAGALFPVCAWEDGSLDRPGIGPPNQLVLYDDAAAQTIALERVSGAITLKLDVRFRRTGPAELTVDDGAAGAVDILPAADKLGRVGTRGFPGAKMWGEVNAFNIVAGDLELRDDDRDAHWVLREEHDRILVTNIKTGRRYAMALIPIDEEKVG